ncbi:MAG TPA: CsbD family protein [Opitutaceae bacterium]|jgi:hypothetical protein
MEPIAAGRYDCAELKERVNAQVAKGSWDIAKGRLKQKYAGLTDDDLRFVEGREELQNFLHESNNKQTRR